MLHFRHSTGNRQRPPIWPRIDLSPLGIDDKTLQNVLIEQQKVAIMPGYTYGDEGKGYVRLNAGCPRSKLEQGVQRLIAGINTLL